MFGMLDGWAWHVERMEGTFFCEGVFGKGECGGTILIDSYNDIAGFFLVRD
jgi:hypothetical protein